MNKFYNKFTSLTHYYKLLYRLSCLITSIKISYIIFFSFIFILSAFFEVSLLGFLYVLLKAFIEPNFYQDNYFFKLFYDFLNIKNNSELILYLSILFIITCLIAGLIRILFQYLLFKTVDKFGNKLTNICYQKILYDDYINLYSKNTNDALSIFQKMPIINNSIHVTLLMLYNIINFLFIFFFTFYRFPNYFLC